MHVCAILSFFHKVHALFFNINECNFYVKMNQQILTLLINELFPDDIKTTQHKVKILLQ